MKNELVRIQDIPEGPSISGTVTVSLAELDKMRADHAQAVKLAKFLEQNQAKVKLTVVEKKYVEKKVEKIRSDRYGLNLYTYPVMEEKYEELGSDYIGLDDVREVIRGEEVEKLKDKLKEAEDTRVKCVELEVEISDLKSEKRKLESDLKELNSKYESEKSELEAAKAQNDYNEKYAINLSNQIKELKSKSGLWYWIFGI